MSLNNTGAYILLKFSSNLENRLVNEGTCKRDLNVALLSSIYKVLVFLHTLSLSNHHKEYMKVKVFKKNGMRVAYAVQKIPKEWKTYLDSASLSSRCSFVEPKHNFDHECGLMTVLRSSSKTVSPRCKEHRCRKVDSWKSDPFAARLSAFNREDAVDAAFQFLPVFMLRNLFATITDIYLSTLPQNSLRERGLIKTTIIPVVGRAPYMEHFRLPQQQFWKSLYLLPLMLCSNLQNTGAEKEIVHVPISNRLAEESVYFTESPFEAVNDKSASRRRVEKETTDPESAPIWLKEYPKTFEDSSAVAVKQKEKIVALQLHASPRDVGGVSKFLRTAMRKNCLVIGVPFQELSDTLDTDGMSPKADVFVADSSCNTPSECDRFGSVYDVFSNQNITVERIVCSTARKTHHLWSWWQKWFATSAVVFSSLQHDWIHNSFLSIGTELWKAPQVCGILHLSCRCDRFSLGNKRCAGNSQTFVPRDGLWYGKVRHCV